MSFKDLLFVKAGGGGGNPNSVQVINGTVANPWGNMTLDEYADFENAYYNGGASAKLAVDTGILGYGTVVFTLCLSNIEPCFWTLVIDGDDMENVTAGTIEYDGTKNLVWAKIATGGVVSDITAFADSFTTTLTIYWHPMPTP